MASSTPTLLQASAASSEQYILECGWQLADSRSREENSLPYLPASLCKTNGITRSYLFCSAAAFTGQN
jgi:hypothetical protein